MLINIHKKKMDETSMWIVGGWGGGGIKKILSRGGGGVKKDGRVSPIFKKTSSEMLQKNKK